jgi:hypothetical protein
MNLSDREKRLFSNILIVLGAIVIFGASFLGVSDLIFVYQSKQEVNRKALIAQYESKIDSIRIVNNMLTYQVDSLDKAIAVTKGKKVYVYIDKTKTDKIIKDASAAEHALAIDSLTKQLPTWAVIKDSITQDTNIHYKFTKPGVINLRLYVNDLKQYKGLYAIDEEVILKQDKEIQLQKTIIGNDKQALTFGKDALFLSEESNSKLTKQLNKAQKRAARWPY